MNNKILLIAKKRETKKIWQQNNFYGSPSSGLLNSVEMISIMLDELNIENKLVEVIDNNSIDREVNTYKPTVVIIEALWVVPEKFRILIKLHPKVKWIIRLHSNTPFLANEGIAIEWIFDYLKHPEIFVASNNLKLFKELQHLTKNLRILYLPNYYNFVSFNHVEKTIDNNFIRIGCFGAIRPLKNQLLQAIAAIDFAEKMELKLKFYINATRIELNGNSILKNIRSLFANSKHELIEIPWLTHEDFLIFLKKNIDIGMQISFSETFNIVAADCISQNIPIVVSKEIDFVFGLFKVNTTKEKEIVFKLKIAYFFQILNFINRLLLKIYIAKTKKTWLKTL